jgi:uncharacterized membrane protein
MNITFQAALLGVIAGMRSMSAPAFVSNHFAYSPETALAQSPLKGLGSSTTACVLTLMALGEVGADKLPGIPNRTAPGPLGARAVSGGVCGAAVFLAAGKSAGQGAALGASAAIAFTFAAYFLRRQAGKVTKIPDFFLAAAEDALVLGLGLRIFAEASS